MLVVDDNDADVVLIQDAIQAADLALTVHVVKDGDEAVRFFDRADTDNDMTPPDLVILDINLPKRPGTEVLRHMRQSQRSRGALVLAVSTSDSARDRQQMSDLGANGYFRKPSEYDEFIKLGDVIKNLLSGTQP
ncbi:MAG: response regulator [Acidobacteriaceae bacterium]|nr:response regulator [Acidobacteriaceae bacterium]